VNGVKEKAYIQVYTGNGKGKTTAAIGLAVRAAGHGLFVYLGQFMKGQPYGELRSLANIPEIEVEQYGDASCIRREDVTREHKQMAASGLEKIGRALGSGRYDVIILDEINTAVWFGLVTVDEVLKLMASRPDGVEIILTGRYAPPEFIDLADLVSEIKEIKHYYRQGVPARDGIER